MSLKRQTYMALATIVIGLLAAFTVIEIALRLFWPQPTGLHTPNHDLHYKTDEFDIRTRFNSLGLRDREYTQKKPDRTFRIVVLGDSITEALQVEDQEVYTEILEASLNQIDSGTMYEVLNLGMSGFGTADELALSERLGKTLEPDLVIDQMSLINDLSENLFCRWYQIEGERIVEPGNGNGTTHGGIGEFFGRYSHFVQLLRHAFRASFGTNAERLENIAQHKERYHALLYADQGTESDFEEDWRKTFLYLEELHERVLESGAQFLLLVRPLDPDVQGLRNSRYPRDILFDFCEEEGIDYLDLTPVFAAKSSGDIHQIRFKADSHWIPQAHRWAADAIWVYLKRHVLGISGGNPESPKSESENRS